MFFARASILKPVVKRGLKLLAVQPQRMTFSQVTCRELFYVSVTRLLCVEGVFVLCGSDNLNTAYRCGQHSLVTAWFGSAGPGNILPVEKKYTLLEVGVHYI